MKEQKQVEGVRRWFGDDWINIQDELMAVLEGHFGHFNQQFILSGCNVSGTSVSAGIVALNTAGGFKLCRFAGAAGVTFPVYFQPVIDEEPRLYLDGEVKAAAINYNCELASSNPGGLLELKDDNTTARFTDAIQDASHRFVTDTEKASYASQANTAISTIRGGVSSTLNTLERLRAYFQNAIDNIETAGVDVDAIYAELRGGIAESMDDLEKLRAAMVARDLEWGKLVNVPEFRGTSELTGSTIDWSGKPERSVTLTGNTQFDASNLIEGKTIGVLIDGAYDSTFTAKFKKAVGSPDPDPNEVNYVQMKCVNATTGSELIIYTVIFIEL